MISAIFIQNTKGNVLVSQIFREELKSSVYSVFFKKIVTIEAKLLKNPILTIGSTSFTYLKEHDLYYVAVSRYNVDVSVVLQYLTDFIRIINALISNGNHIHDVNIMDNVLPIYEILDLTLDQGYIKSTNLEFIRKHITFPVYQIKKCSINSTAFEVLTDNEELNALYQIDTHTQLQENEALLQVDEFIHVPPKGKIKIIGELLVASRKSLTYEIKSEVKGHDIHSIILSPLIENSKDQLNSLKAVSISNTACLLNYHGYCQLNELPIVIVGTMKQIQSNAYCLEVSIIPNRTDIIIKDLTIKIPAPKIISKLTTEFGHVMFEDSENIEESVIVWNFPRLALSDFKNRFEEKITFKKNLTVDSSFSLDSWMSGRNNTLVTYDFEGYNISQFNVISYQIDDGLNKRFIKKVFLTYEVKI